MCAGDMRRETRSFSQRNSLCKLARSNLNLVPLRNKFVRQRSKEWDVR